MRVKAEMAENRDTTYTRGRRLRPALSTLKRLSNCGRDASKPWLQIMRPYDYMWWKSLASSFGGCTRSVRETSKAANREDGKKKKKRKIPKERKKKRSEHGMVAGHHYGDGDN